MRAERFLRMFYYYLIIINCFSLILVKANENASHQLKGPNVCRVIIENPVEVITTELQSLRVRETYWCLSVPPRCSIYNIVHRTVRNVQNITKASFVTKCCDDYQPNSSGDGCIPQTIGYVKPECVAGTYGENCDQVCNCRNNSTCDQVTGHCSCLSGWAGTDCSVELFRGSDDRDDLTDTRPENQPSMNQIVDMNVSNVAVDLMIIIVVLMILSAFGFVFRHFCLKNTKAQTKYCPYGKIYSTTNAPNRANTYTTQPSTEPLIFVSKSGKWIEEGNYDYHLYEEIKPGQGSEIAGYNCGYDRLNHFPS